jgi:hypothetical protein
MRYCYLLVLVATIFAGCNPDTSRVTELFPVQVGNKYGYADRGGKMAIPAKYDEASYFRDGLALIGENKAWGYIDKTGKSVIPAQYNEATTFSEGTAFAVKNGSAPTAIDKTGNVKFTLTQAEQVENFSEGYAAFSVITEKGERWGFVDKEGKVKIQPKYVMVGYFSENICSAMNDEGKWGFIDKDNNVAVAFKYDNVSACIGNSIRVLQGGKWGTIDAKSAVLIEPIYDNLEADGGAFVAEKDGKWGWIDRKGKVIVKMEFDDALPFNGSNYAAVRKGAKWGYADKTGKITIAPQFEFAFGFDGNMALIGQNQKYGFIDKEGRSVVMPRFDQVNIDYIISYFGKNSAYNSVRTDINEPKHVAYLWLSSFYHMQYEEAKKLSSEDTKALLEQFAGLTSYMSDSSRREMLKVKVGIKNSHIQGDQANVVYNTSDNPEKEQIINLVNTKGRWLVQFSKNDIAGSENPADMPQQNAAQQQKVAQ